MAEGAWDKWGRDFAILLIFLLATAAFFLALFYIPGGKSHCGTCTDNSGNGSRQDGTDLISGSRLVTDSVSRSKLFLDVQRDLNRTRSGRFSGLSWDPDAVAMVVTAPMDPPMPCFMYTFDLRTADGFPISFDPVERTAGELALRLPALRQSRDLVGGDLGVVYCAFVPGDGFEAYTLELTSGATANVASVSLRDLKDQSVVASLWTVAPGTLPDVSASVAEEEAGLWVSPSRGHAAVTLESTMSNVLFLPGGNVTSLTGIPVAMGDTGRLLVQSGSRMALVDSGGTAVAVASTRLSDVGVHPFANGKVLVGGQLYSEATGALEPLQLEAEASLPGVFENPSARCATFAADGTILVLFEDQTRAWWKVVAYDGATLKKRFNVGVEERVAALDQTRGVRLRAQTVDELIWVTVEKSTGQTLLLQEGSNEPQYAPAYMPGMPQQLVKGAFADKPMLVLARDSVARTTFSDYYWYAVSTQ